MLFFIMLFVVLLAFFVARYVLAPFQDLENRRLMKTKEDELRRLHPKPTPAAAVVKEVEVPEQPELTAKAVDAEFKDGRDKEVNLDVPAVFRSGLYDASSVIAANLARVKRATAAEKAKLTRMHKQSQESHLAAQRERDLELLQRLEELSPNF